MKKVIDGLGWISVALTMVTLIITILTTYLYNTYISRFYSCEYLQICIISTMIIWAINMQLDKKERRQNMMNSVFCVLIAAGTMFFMYKGVF